MCLSCPAVVDLAHLPLTSLQGGGWKDTLMWFSLYNTFFSCSSNPSCLTPASISLLVEQQLLCVHFFFCITLRLYPCTLQSPLTGRRKGGKKNYFNRSTAGNIPSGNECVWIEMVAWAGLPVVKAAQISWEGKALLCAYVLKGEFFHHSSWHDGTMWWKGSYLLLHLSFHMWMQQLSPRLFLWTSLV